MILVEAGASLDRRDYQVSVHVYVCRYVCVLVWIKCVCVCVCECDGNSSLTV